MRATKLAIGALLASGLAAAAFAASPAQAGDTNRVRGCAAHWRTTAAWNECIADSGQPVQVSLNVACDWESDYSGPWKTVQGYVNPLDEMECWNKAADAWNGIK